MNPAFNDKIHCLQTNFHLRFKTRPTYCQQTKRKHIHKTLLEKCQAFKAIQTQLPNRDGKL